MCKWCLRRNTRFILLLWYVFFFQTAELLYAWNRAATGQGGVVRRSKVIYTPGSLLAQLLHERSHVGKTWGQLPSLHSAKPHHKPKPSSPNGLRLSGEFLLLLSPLESASQSGYINPGSRTWGLVRDTARLEETQRMFLGWWKKSSTIAKKRKRNVNGLHPLLNQPALCDVTTATKTYAVSLVVLS